MRNVAGEPVSTYALNELDRQRILRGTALLCELMLEAGAKRIVLPFAGVPDMVDADGVLLDVREDVGRHNAVDKLLGRAFLDGKTPLGERPMVVSGRASFEILQKALVAGVPMIVAIGAPSSLAVQMAEKFGMTLIGFASEERFNVYTGRQRVLGE